MNRPRQFLALLAGGIGTAAALLGAPFAAADESGGGGANNPMTPDCQNSGGGNAGQTSVCASPGSAEISATPNDLGIEGAMVDEGGAMMGGFGGFR